MIKLLSDGMFIIAWLEQKEVFASLVNSDWALSEDTFNPHAGEFKELKQLHIAPTSDSGFYLV